MSNSCTILVILAFTASVCNANQLISPIIATDLANSANADVLVDKSFALSSSAPWSHSGNQWQNNGYPWMASLDFGQQYQLSHLKYFSGSIPFPDTSKLTIEGSIDGQVFVSIAVGESPQYDNWNKIQLEGVYQFLRVRFNAVDEHFYITEIKVYSSSIGTTSPSTTTTTTGTTSGTVSSPPPHSSSWNPNTNLQHAVPLEGQQSNGYLKWPKKHLNPACREFHDRFWTRGPKADPSVDFDNVSNNVEYLAYHTWHPAIGTLPGGDQCDFGHEHGNNPSLADPDMFELFGGWPAFGYVAAKNDHQRVEDHVGHKVTVAKFGAALGDGGNSGSQLYDAGFECHWLSKIHQGSYSMDAFSNHSHEYFLAFSCNDGPNNTPGTRLSIKFLYTFGKANEFNPLSCGHNPQQSSNVNDPNGNPIEHADQTSPEPNQKVNGREFACYNKLGWKAPEDLQQVDLWTQPINIEQGNDEPIFIQPYYVVKNPARMLNHSKSVQYTVDLCRSDPKLGFCDQVPNFTGEWDGPGTPFNGALRNLNFKKVALYNDNGRENWCTDAFGRGTGKARSPPCGLNEIEQHANSFRNGWDWKTVNGNSGEVKGAWWTEDVCGNVKTANSMGSGYEAFGIGFEFVVDNREPDDDCDGTPDGATLRGEN